MTIAGRAVPDGMKKLLLVGSQAFVAVAFVASQAQADPAGAAFVALLAATGINLALAFTLTNKRFGGKDEFNGSFSLAKLGNFLKDDYATTRCLVLAVALVAAGATQGMSKDAFEALFIAGAAAQTAAIVADNTKKAQAVLAGLFPVPTVTA